ncbi:HAD-superfamily subfamily IB hydrolase [Luminiphilus syltensis NOR5-1B]|uniref:HAD-superfamily subfamily IB hydrolase n=1 Tax=Luminiphilus syltensis NOR5-1B TaxID=565045 RepID=B8KU45_9GAMM|nr:HAD family hydrolase [Luminiphilus syltensis]EED34374.1 HAD-superfamily subfamily IB hydrolase [Luminiphilus syltensis NOR5-1B]
MTLAIFDLDNTLIAGDSDHLWGEFVCDIGLANSASHREKNAQFAADYRRGELDVLAYLHFALDPIRGMDPTQVEVLQNQFMTDYIESLMLPRADALIADHRARGHTLLIITATNTVVTRPIADRLGIEHLIGCEPEIIGGCYTGASVGVPSYREGKVVRLKQWLGTHSESMADAWFYSDSHNDLPLLREVAHPVAVDPDTTLKQIADQNQWPVISLR